MVIETLESRQVTATEAAHAAPVACRGVVKRFGNGATALAGVDVDCAAGEILVLLGPSGCGKTTLLRCVAGLERPTEGTIAIGDRDVTAVDPQRRGVAMVFQNYALYPDKTAAENITFPLRRARVPKDEQRRRLAAIAELLRLTELLDRRPAQLSGGQKQRVGIGRALARGPRVLLMDEPLSNLDAQLRVEMRAELLSLQRRLGTTILYVTHEQTEALTLGDRVVVLRDGRVEQSGPPRAIYDVPRTAFVAQFLGAMNLVEGHCTDGDLIALSGARLALPAGLDVRRGEAIRLGVRPEALTIAEADLGSSDGLLRASGVVRLVEHLGADDLVHVDVGGVVVRVRMPAGTGTREHVTVTAGIEDLHLFAADGRGERIGFAS